MIRVAVAGENGGFQVKSVVQKALHLRSGRARRIERFIVDREEVPERVIQRLDQIGRAVFLITVKIESCQLPGTYQ